MLLENRRTVTAAAVILMIALLSTSCTGTEHATEAPPDTAAVGATDIRSAAIHSDFTELPDGAAPSTFTSGQAASVAPTADPSMDLRIINGKLTFAPTTGGAAAGYFLTPDLGKPVTRIGMRWAFTPQTGGTPGVAAMAITGTPANPIGGASPLMPLHFIVTRDGWNYSLSPGTSGGGAELIPLAAGTFDTPLVEDGNTVHEVQIWISGNTATIDLPDGNRKEVRDPRIESWASRYAFFEPYTDRAQSDSIAGFTEVWSDTSSARAPA